MASLRSRAKQRLTAEWHHLAAVPRSPQTAALARDTRARHPRFRPAVAADARVTAGRRGERNTYRSNLDLVLQVIRLCLVTESFFAQVCYRAKTRCRARGIPLVPVLLDRLCFTFGQVSIDDHVVMGPGVFIPHGMIMVGGITAVGSGSTLSPFVSVGLLSGNVEGPVLGEYVTVGTGVRIMGPVKVGDHATIGAGAVVVRDVPSRATVAGVPARRLA